MNPLPCPYCGEPAELDTQQGYRVYTTGEISNAISVYCTRCPAQISVCILDVPDITADEVVGMWNKRADATTEHEREEALSLAAADEAVARPTTLLRVEPDPTHDALLQGQPKPTGEQLDWVFSHLADLCQSNGQSFGFLIQRMYGFPSQEKHVCMGAGQFVTNFINEAIERNALDKRAQSTEDLHS